MNPEPTDRWDADALDAFWDGLVFDQIAGNAHRAATSPNEEMVMNLHSLLTPRDEGAATRLRGLVFGTEPAAVVASGPIRPLPIARPEPIRPSRSIRSYAHLAAAALIVMLVGALVAAQSTGFFGGRGGNDAPTAIPAAFVQPDATPASLASPIAANNGVLWTLPFAGTNVEIGASALADGTLYRLIRSDEFTGVQAVDTATGTELWRSAQEWSGSSIAAGLETVAFLNGDTVTALSSTTGDVTWTSNPLIDSTPVSIAGAENTIYVWNGISTIGALDASTGDLAWATDAGLTLDAPGVTAAQQAPVVTSKGVTAVSATGMVVFFDAAGDAAGTIGEFVPETMALAAAPDGSVVLAGQPRMETEQTWPRKLMLVDPASGSAIWATDYNALVTGVTVTDTMALVLADNPGLAMTQVELVESGTATTVDLPPYPEETSPQIYGYDLETGQLYYEMDESTGTGHGWVTDAGTSPYVALTTGPAGPIAISESGQMDFFTTENPLVQAVVNLPGALPSQVVTDDAAVYTSVDNGTLTALAPTLANVEPQPVDPGGNLDWSMPAAGTLVEFGGMAYGEGLVLRLIDTGAGRQIEATHTLTGQPAWTLAFDWSTDQIVADPGPDPYDPAQTWTGSGNIFAVDSGNRLFAIDGTSGTSSWQHPFADPVVSFIYDADTLYVWDESGTMTALLPQDGTVLWATTPGDASGPQSNELGMPIPAVTRTTIAMVDAGGTLQAFSKETGEVLWSVPGFDGTNTRIVRQGNATADQPEIFVIVSAQGDARSDGTFEQTVSGVLAQDGQRVWESYLQGPLVQPVHTDETLVVVTGNQLQPGKSVAVETTPVIDAEGHNHYIWTGSGEPAPAGGGERLFALDAESGQIVWIRSSAAGGFTELATKFPGGSGTLYAVTSDGLLVSPSRGNGTIDGEPTALGRPVIGMVPSGETGAVGSFATLVDGTLVAFGGTPFSQQG